MDVSGKVWAEATLALTLVVALASGVAEYRQRKRRDLDRVSLLDWRNVQLWALIAAVIALVVALEL